MNRNEQSSSQSENFTYDSMNRLTTGVEYDENGNILFKADAGTYQYEASHPHAISSLSPTSNEVLPKLDLSVTYNSVRLPVRLSEGDKTYTLTYNGENSRVKSQFVQNGSTVFTKYYCGPYEEIQKGGTTRKITIFTAMDRLWLFIRKERPMPECIISITTTWDLPG